MKQARNHAIIDRSEYFGNYTEMGIIMKDQGITGVVLAGGRSKRMGKNKALLQLGNVTMIEQVVSTLKLLFQEIIVVTNTPEEYDMLKGVRLVEDYIQSSVRSSLIGLYSGLLTAKNKYIFATACDMPLLSLPLIKFMREQIEDQDIIIPCVNGYHEPLHSFYSKNCLAPMKRQLDQKDYRISNFFSEVKVTTVQESAIRKFDPYLHSFLNINSFEEYHTLKNIFLKTNES